MARISIDDELHADHRFKRLVRKLGNEDLAIGMIYRFWRIAQDFWADDYGLMPVSEFEIEEFGPILDVGLAEKQENGIYACGAEERFGWYVGKLKGGEATKKKWAEKKSAIAENVSAKAEVDSAIVEPRPSLLTAPLRTASLLSAPLRSDIAPIKEKEVAPAAAAGPPPGSVVWNAYSEAYAKRYQGEKPLRNAKQNALCKQVAQRIPADEASEVAQFYLGLNGFYATRGHPLNLLVQDCEKIRTEWKTGTVIKPDRPKGFAEIKSDANQELYRRVQRGEL